VISPDRQAHIRQLFDDYLEMYVARDDRLTERFSDNFSGYAGSSDVLVKDREAWIKVTRQDFAQVPKRVRIEMVDLALQDLSAEVVMVTAFFHIHLPMAEEVLSGKWRAWYWFSGSNKMTGKLYTAASPYRTSLPMTERFIRSRACKNAMPRWRPWSRSARSSSRTV
jgi:hypothetical protein